MNVLQHNFPAFCRYDNKWFSRKWQNYGLFSYRDFHYYFFFYHEIHFHCRNIWQGHQMLVLLLRNLNGCKLVGTSWGKRLQIIECTIHIKSIRLIARLYETAMWNDLITFFFFKFNVKLIDFISIYWGVFFN